MQDVNTTSSWQSFPCQTDSFVEEWTEFASWASEAPGAGAGWSPSRERRAR